MEMKIRHLRPFWARGVIGVTGIGFLLLTSGVLSHGSFGSGSKSLDDLLQAELDSPLFKTQLELKLEKWVDEPDLSQGDEDLLNNAYATPLSELFSACIYSFCLGSMCLVSKCTASMCSSVCIASNCAVSICLSSNCLGSACDDSNCFGSACRECEDETCFPNSPRMLKFNFKPMPPLGFGFEKNTLKWAAQRGQKGRTALLGWDENREEWVTLSEELLVGGMIQSSEIPEQYSMLSLTFTSELGGTSIYRTQLVR